MNDGSRLKYQSAKETSKEQRVGLQINNHLGLGPGGEASHWSFFFDNSHGQTWKTLNLFFFSFSFF